MAGVCMLEPVERLQVWSAEDNVALLAEIDAKNGLVRLVGRRHRLSENLL
jgi:hypothetical protein